MEIIKYDKDDWHCGAPNFPKEQDQKYGYVHIVFFVRWSLENNLLSDAFMKENQKEISLLNKNQITTTDFFQRTMCGHFMSHNVSPKGRLFIDNYYSKTYLNDFFGVVFNTKSYYVEDSLENYYIIKTKISNDYEKTLNSI